MLKPAGARWFCRTDEQSDEEEMDTAQRGLTSSSPPKFVTTLLLWQEATAFMHYG